MIVRETKVGLVNENTARGFVFLRDATNNWPEVSASAHDQALLNQILKAESSSLIPTQPRPK